MVGQDPFRVFAEAGQVNAEVVRIGFWNHTVWED
jgi:hypothetical protein